MAWVTREPVQVTQRPERLQPGAQQQGGKPLLAPHNQLGAWKPLRPSQPGHLLPWAEPHLSPNCPFIHTPLRNRDLCLLWQEEAKNRAMVEMMQ